MHISLLLLSDTFVQDVVPDCMWCLEEASVWRKWWLHHDTCCVFLYVCWWSVGIHCWQDIGFLQCTWRSLYQSGNLACIVYGRHMCFVPGLLKCSCCLNGLPFYQNLIISCFMELTVYMRSLSVVSLCLGCRACDVCISQQKMLLWTLNWRRHWDWITVYITMVCQASCFLFFGKQHLIFKLTHCWCVDVCKTILKWSVYS